MERNIYFICLCGKHLAAIEAVAGQEVNCPDCGKTLIIPSSDMEWVCSCGAPILIPANLSKFGESINCIECNAIHKVPEIEILNDDPEQKPMPVEPMMPISTPQQQNKARVHILKQNDQPQAPYNPLRQNSPKSFDHSTKCPSCGSSIKPNVALCVNCGLDFKTGKKMKSVDDVKMPKSSDTPFAINKDAKLSRYTFASWFIRLSRIIAILLVLGAVGYNAIIYLQSWSSEFNRYNGDIREAISSFKENYASLISAQIDFVKKEVQSRNEDKQPKKDYAADYRALLVEANKATSLRKCKRVYDEYLIIHKLMESDLPIIDDGDVRRLQDKVVDAIAKIDRIVINIPDLITSTRLMMLLSAIGSAFSILVIADFLQCLIDIAVNTSRIPNRNI